MTYNGQIIKWHCYLIVIFWQNVLINIPPKSCALYVILYLPFYVIGLHGNWNGKIIQ